MRLRTFGIFLIGLACSGTGANATPVSTSAHAMIVSGNAQGGSGPFGCATSGPQAGVSHFFGTGVGLPLEGYASCNLAGGINDTSTLVGPSTAHEALTNPFSNGIHTQTADATADFSTLKASSDGLYTGDAIGGFAYHAGEADAMSTDSLRAAPGGRFIQMGFTIDGSASVVGNAQVQTLLNYQINSGPVFTLFVGNIQGTSPPFVISGTNAGGSLAGFTITPHGYSGLGTVFTFLEEITPDVPFDLTLGLYTASYPTPFGGGGNNDFLETATLTSISVFDAAMNPLDATLTSASGRIYNATGVHSPDIGGGGGVPETPTWIMLLLSLGMVGVTIRRQRSAALGV